MSAQCLDVVFQMRGNRLLQDTPADAVDDSKLMESREDGPVERAV